MWEAMRASKAALNGRLHRRRCTSVENVFGAAFTTLLHQCTSGFFIASMHAGTQQQSGPEHLTDYTLRLRGNEVKLRDEKKKKITCKERCNVKVNLVTYLSYVEILKLFAPPSSTLHCIALKASYHDAL